MKLDRLVQVLSQTHSSLQQQASQAVNFSLVVRNWLFGYYIVEFEQQGEDRAQYGSRLLNKLSESLTLSGVPGCSTTNLKNCRIVVFSIKLTQRLVRQCLTNCSIDYPSRN
jgi:DUF1016 N-terminal domain